jgi:methanogenic corrinoid protein MtbC1
VHGRTAPQLSRVYLEALRAADTAGAYRIASQALAEGLSLAALYQRVIAPAMHELGRLWQRGAITVADEHLATALTHRVLATLRPNPRDAEPRPRPRVLLAAVPGEQHALGLQMAADLLEDVGWQPIYLGADVPTEALLQAIEVFSPDLLGLTVTMPDLTPVLEGTVTGVRTRHPLLHLVVGGQASASRKMREATPVDDLELLDQRVRELMA